MKNALKIVVIIAKILVSLLAVYLLLILGSLAPAFFWALLLLLGVIVLIFCLAGWKNKSDNFSIYTLTIINIVISAFLLVLYFFIFDLVTGLYWPAVTWGVPLFAGIIYLIVHTIYMVRKKEQKRGMHGFTIGVGAFVYTAIIVIFFSYLLIGTPHHNPEKVANQTENKILELVLQKLYGEGLGYALISPETTVNPGGYDDNYLEYIRKKISDFPSVYHEKTDQSLFLDGGSLVTDQTEFQALADRFIEVNRFPHTLDIPSSPRDGYYIDYDERYSPDIWYSWPLWRSLHPTDGPLVEISLPVYDENSGFVIIYAGADSGNIYFFRYQNGEIMELGHIGTWVS